MDRNGSAESDWMETIRSHRTAKEATLASKADTPLSEPAQAQFEGLEFFPIAPEYRLTARLEVFSEPREAAIEATRGPPMSFESVGQLGVEFEGDLSVLTVYRSPGVTPLFVPFRDRTNGETTWRHGRYLNVQAPASMADDAERVDQSKPVDVTVDFNVAYHPLCVYDETVRSAKPPTDSELPVAVRAGERL